jgi:hypothetical protein
MLCVYLCLKNNLLLLVLRKDIHELLWTGISIKCFLTIVKFSCVNITDGWILLNSVKISSTLCYCIWLVCHQHIWNILRLHGLLGILIYNCVLCIAKVHLYLYTRIRTCTKYLPTDKLKEVTTYILYEITSCFIFLNTVCVCVCAHTCMCVLPQTSQVAYMMHVHFSHLIRSSQNEFR